MPGDSLNNIGYLDVQFGGLDFGTDDSFENLSEKLNNSVNLGGGDGQQQSQQQQQQQQQKSLTQSPPDVSSSYEQSKSVVTHQQQQQQQQSALTSAGLQNSHLVKHYITCCFFSFNYLYIFNVFFFLNRPIP